MTGILVLALALPFAGCSYGKKAQEPQKMPKTMAFSMAQKNLSLQQINAVEAGKLTELGEDAFARKNDTLYKDGTQNVYAFDSLRRFTFYNVGYQNSSQQNFLCAQMIPTTNSQFETQIHSLLKGVVPHIEQFQTEIDPTSVDPTWKSLVRKVGRGEKDCISVHYKNGAINFLSVEYYTEHDEPIPEAKKKVLDEQAQNALQALKKKNGADQVKISKYAYTLNGNSITGSYSFISCWNNPDAPGNPAKNVDSFDCSIAK